MHYLIDKDEFLRALQGLDEELTIEIDSEVVSHAWRCAGCGHEHVTFEMTPAPLMCHCGETGLLPVWPTLH